ncbi:MAG: polysaccharide biosynthesis protein [Planctomycetaceae bacterium]|nr:polysaccharide biosynthesis protein [Planctomycetaceae bacterium]
MARLLSSHYFLFALHTLLFLAICYIAFGVRFDLNFYGENKDSVLPAIILIVGVKVAVFYINRHFRDVWYYATVKNLQRLLLSSLISLLIIYTARTLLLGRLYLPLPRSIPLIDAMLTIMILGGLRLGLRMIHEDVRPKFYGNNLKKSLLIGANYEGAKLAAMIRSYPEMEYDMVGFVTIHPEKVKSMIGSIPVLGHFDHVIDVAQKHHVTDILVISGVLTGKQMRTLIDQCQNAGLNLRVIPQIEMRLGNRHIPIRDINIDDLLKRDPIHLDAAKIRELVDGRRVLVTGAGGSIGSEICRQLLRFSPATLVTLGRGENRIFFLERELKRMARGEEIVPVIADITNEERMNQVFETYRPEVVFHAAAHKHVPLMETNISEAVRNNINGTKVVADLSDEYDVKTFVLVSTDKAVNPTSVMGTSKHLAERYVHAMSRGSMTQFVVTRFGNVLGSAGSVVPIFKEQIQNGGPITITDERMTRFFMTIPEAAQLVLQAAAMGNGGEIFVLDMGEPVKIVELARDLIRLAGLPEDGIEIQFTGLRPGEKLYEELYFESETTLQTPHPKLLAAQHRSFPIEEVRSQIETLSRMCDAPNEELRKALKTFVPEYKPFQELPTETQTPRLSLQT